MAESRIAVYVKVAADNILLEPQQLQGFFRYEYDYITVYNYEAFFYYRIGGIRSNSARCV